MGGFLRRLIIPFSYSIFLFKMVAVVGFKEGQVLILGQLFYDLLI